MVTILYIWSLFSSVSCTFLHWLSPILLRKHIDPWAITVISISFFFMGKALLTTLHNLAFVLRSPIEVSYCLCIHIVHYCIFHQSHFLPHMSNSNISPHSLGTIFISVIRGRPELRIWYQWKLVAHLLSTGPSTRLTLMSPVAPCLRGRVERGWEGRVSHNFDILLKQKRKENGSLKIVSTSTKWLYLFHHLLFCFLIFNKKIAMYI